MPRAIRVCRLTLCVGVVLSAGGVAMLSGCQAQPGPAVESFPPPDPGAATFGYADPADSPGRSLDPYAGAPGGAVFVPADGGEGAGAMPGPGGTYTVQKGDTLWSIASKVYGNGQRHKDILAANPQVNPSRLLVGQTLVLP